MLNVVKHNNFNRKIHVGEYTLLLLSHEHELDNENLSFIDGIVIDTTSDKQALGIIKQIRLLSSLKNSLMPIYIGTSDNLSKEIEIHTDGYINLNNNKNEFVQRIAAIKGRINKLQPPKNSKAIKEVEYKILAYLYTRNRLLTPVKSRVSLIGYIFPYASLFFKNEESLDLLNTLESLANKGWTLSSLHDYIHACKSCTSSYLNIKECCPKCNAIDIQSNDMVHHFVCAHVAPEKDFKTSDGLECPKCDKQLRHIGIDYDKPSNIYDCNQCNHEFQNSGMKATCIDCNTEHELDELLEKKITTCSITQKGETLLLKSKNIVLNDTEVNLGNISTTVFKIILNQELQRVKSLGAISQFVKVTFQSKQLALLNADVKMALTNEILTILKSYLKEADVVAAKSYDTYYILLPETKNEYLKRLELIQFNLSRLLNDNVTTTQDEVEIFIEELSKEQNVDYYLNL